MNDIVKIIKPKLRNILINGDFAINQRSGSTLIPGTFVYTMDRMITNSGDSSQQVVVAGENFGYAGQIVSTATGGVYEQRVESIEVVGFRGKTVTLAVKLKLISGAWSAQVPQLRTANPPTKDTFSVITNVVDFDLEPDDGGSTFPTGSFRIFKATFTITDEMADKGLYVAWGDFAAKTGVVQFAEVMVVEGIDVSEFVLSRTTVSDELNICQRYFFNTAYPEYKHLTVAAVHAMGRGFIFCSTNANSAYGDNRYPQPMRVTPSLTKHSADSYCIEGSSFVGGMGGFDRKNQVCCGEFTSSAAFVNGRHYQIHVYGDAEL